MGVWFPSPDLPLGEVVEFQAAANHLVGKRSVGGQVTVTDRRLLFLPNRLDGLLGGGKVEVLRGAITSTRVLAAGRQAVRDRGVAAGLRPQLEVEWHDGASVFVVSDLGALQAALAARRA